jgi:hypothetical protein
MKLAVEDEWMMQGNEQRRRELLCGKFSGIKLYNFLSFRVLKEGF